LDAIAAAERVAELAEAAVNDAKAEVAAAEGIENPLDQDARQLTPRLLRPRCVAMRAALRPGGVLAVEDLFLGTLRSDPPAPALGRLQEVYGETVRFHGGDQPSARVFARCCQRADW
jgi:hypothetical protein